MIEKAFHYSCFSERSDYLKYCKHNCKVCLQMSFTIIHTSEIAFHIVFRPNHHLTNLKMGWLLKMTFIKYFSLKIQTLLKGVLDSFKYAQQTVIRLE